MKHLKAVILAGGFGTRLRPLSCTRPKILFPIVNKPLLQRTLESLAQHRIKEAILAVDSRTENFIKQHEIPRCGLRLNYSVDPLAKPLGTGGPIRRAEKLLNHDSFLVLNGDIITDIDYRELLKTHEEKEAIATIALHKVKDPSRYGVAQLKDKDRIQRFIEKPPKEEAPTNLANAGVYILSPEIFKYITTGKKVSIERQIFPRLANQGKLYGHIFDGLWMDMGKLEDYLKINRILLDSLTNDREHKIGGEVEVKGPVAFDKGSSVKERSIIGPYTVLGRNVSVGERVCIQHTVVFPGAQISDCSFVNQALIGENVVLGRKVRIGQRCVLGDYVRVKDHVSLAEGVSVCPGKEVSESVLTPKYIM